VVDGYIDVNLPYPSAKVAGILCIGGSVKYALLQDGRSGIINDWLFRTLCQTSCSPSI
jgi:hypothetical protein